MNKIMIDIPNLMSELARSRQLFHSEADFQHALAWRIHKTIPDCGVRLEYKPFPDKRFYLDLWLDRIGVAIELKYRTRELRIKRQGELFALRNQSANDISRYDFLRDVSRLERLSQLSRAKAGYAIFLTNDHLYWSEPTRKTIDADFRLHEDRPLCGKMAWLDRASEGTRKGREEPIRLKGSYKAQWREYDDVEGEKYGRLRYLVIRTSY